MSFLVAIEFLISYLIFLINYDVENLIMLQIAQRLLTHDRWACTIPWHRLVSLKVLYDKNFLVSIFIIHSLITFNDYFLLIFPVCDAM